MKQRPRIYYSDAQKALMWDRWEQGDSIHDIARLFDRGHSSIQRILAESGGIRPAARRRSRLALTLAEREELSRGVVAGRSLRSIAALLGRAASTISREISRNAGDSLVVAPITWQIIQLSHASSLIPLRRLTWPQVIENLLGDRIRNSERAQGAC